MIKILICLMGFSAGALADNTVLFLGDSLTDGYGIQRDLAYPALLEKKWQSAGRKVKVINGAESGSLASSLSERIAFYNGRFKPTVIVIATGGNDGRQLTPVNKIEASLDDAIIAAKATGAKVALVAMKVFPNLGKEYVTAFAELYPRLAKKNQITLIPFLLSDVAGIKKFNQADGFHPNVQGHAKIAETIGPQLEKLL